MIWKLLDKRFSFLCTAFLLVYNHKKFYPTLRKVLIYGHLHQVGTQQASNSVWCSKFMLDAAASPLNARILLSRVKVTLPNSQTTFDLNNVREFLEACLQLLLREETKACRWMELGYPNLTFSTMLYNLWSSFLSSKHFLAVVYNHAKFYH